MPLMEDEQLVLRWLSQYGPLSKNVLRRFLHYKNTETRDRILVGMRRRRYIYEIQGGKYYAVDKYDKPVPKMQTAVWVLLQFSKQIKPDHHYQATVPSQIFFLKGKLIYEILVLREGEEHLIRLLQPQENTKYIIVVPNMEMAENLQLPKAPCLFATVEPTDKEEPKITFYSAQGD